MARPRFKAGNNGPGLLYIVAAVIVVAVVAARWLGFAPGQPVTNRVGPPAAVNQVTEIPNTDRGTNLEAVPVATGPQVLVYHAHGSENYSPAPPHTKKGQSGDILTVGEAFVRALDEKGIEALHARNVHDYPTYDQAFSNANVTVTGLLKDNGSIDAVIDIHRDALDNKPDGYTTTTIDGQKVAKVLLVVGNVDNPNVTENIAFAQKLKETADSMYPGLMRSVKILPQEANGAVHPNAVQVHLGEYRDNTVEEARRAAQLFADVVAVVLQDGTR